MSKSRNAPARQRFSRAKLTVPANALSARSTSHPAGSARGNPPPANTVTHSPSRPEMVFSGNTNPSS